MNEIIKVIGKQELNGKEITIIEGGFGEGNKCMLFSDIAKEHEVEPKYINKLIGLNIERYNKNDLIDLCSENFKVHAKNLGLITSNSQKYCYLLSERGYIKLVSSMANDNEKKWEVMDKVINEYFRMRNELKISEKDKLLLGLFSNDKMIVAQSYQSLLELEKKPLLDKIEEDSPFVKLAKERYDKGKKVSLTDATKSLGLKKGQISTYLKINGYLSKNNTEVNKKGENMFGIYEEGNYKCIGILEEGVKFINEHIEDIKNSPCKFKK